MNRNSTKFVGGGCTRDTNRRIFKLALEKAGLSAQEVWYIGDNYECHIQGALAVGITPVWYLGASDIFREQKMPFFENLHTMNGLVVEG